MIRGLLASAAVLKHIVRQRPELAVFGIGVVLFAGGLASVISGQLSVESSFEELPSPARARAGPANRARVGPAVGEALGPYIRSKRALLAGKASQDPRVESLGMVVFKSYRTVGQVEALMKSRDLAPLAAYLRVPVETFAPAEVTVGREGLRGAIEEQKAAIAGELEVLEGVLSDVTDPVFEAVYTKDAERKREALRLLDNDPALVFALVVRETYTSLARLAENPDVRYVDVPEEARATLSTHSFSPPLPEETDKRGSL